MSDKTIENLLKLEMRFNAIEHLLCKTVAAMMLGSNKTQSDIDILMKGTSETIRQMTFAKINPAISDAASAELEDAVVALYNLVKVHMASIQEDLRR